MRHRGVVRTWVRRSREWQIRGRHRAVGLVIGLRVMVFVRRCIGRSLGKHDGLRHENGKQQQQRGHPFGRQNGESYPVYIHATAYTEEIRWMKSIACVR